MRRSDLNRLGDHHAHPRRAGIFGGRNLKSLLLLVMILLIVTGSRGFAQPCLDALGTIDLSSTGLSFGNVQVGSASVKTFSIVNIGKEDMNVLSISSDTSQFTVQSSPSIPFCIHPGQAQSIGIAFQPNQSGSFNVTISVDSTGGMDSISVSGTGVQTGIPDIAVSPTQLQFGNINVGTFRQLALRISNSGTGALQVESFADDPCFRVTPPGPYSVRPGGVLNLKVRLIACSTGSLRHILHVLSNDPNEVDVPVTLIGNGIPGALGLLNQTNRLGRVKTFTTGSQWIDINGDDLLDLFVTGSRGNAAFLNSASGTFRNRTRKSKLGRAGQTVNGASWADVDNDGDLDVFLAEASGQSALYENKKGVFTRRSSAATISQAKQQDNASGGIWLDFNRDGRVDLFIVRNGEPNSLLKNEGVFQFRDVATSAGVRDQGPGRSAVAADFNNDGYQDLYVVNFQQSNRLYLNAKNETFQNASSGSRANLTGSYIQAVASDYDGDQDIDLFVVNEDGPCTLLKNNGKGKFVNVTASARLSKVRNVTSASFQDIDMDGDEDLIVLLGDLENRLYLNGGKGRFKKVSNIDFNAPDHPSSISTADFNNDGFPDAFIGDATSLNNSLYRNSASGNNWLTIVLEGSSANRAAIGAGVLVRAGLLPQFKVVSGGDGKNQESLPLEFGLGTQNQAQSVTIFWPGGNTQTLDNVPANQTLRITEP